MNYALIATNVLIYLWLKAVTGGDFLGMSDGEGSPYGNALETWGYTPSVGAPLTLFSCMFLHANLMHLGGNMLYLWIFGDNIEARLGPLGYLVAYLATGVVATLAFAWPNADSTHPLVGASGAISGVQGLYFIACPKHRVKMFFWFYMYVNRFLVNARLVMLFWFIMNDVLGLFAAAAHEGGGVAHLAHLGGFASGLLLMLGLRPLVRRIEQAAEGEISEEPHSWRYERPPGQHSYRGRTDRYRPRWRHDAGRS